MATTDLLFPFHDTPRELEMVEYDQAYQEWWEVLERHPNKSCPPSVKGEHCMECQYLTGDQFYAWRRLMIINRKPE